VGGSHERAYRWPEMTAADRFTGIGWRVIALATHGRPDRAIAR
jgi:hypothetical protein